MKKRRQTIGTLPGAHQMVAAGFPAFLFLSEGKEKKLLRLVNLLGPARYL
jgi:hypothetical protein